MNKITNFYQNNNNNNKINDDPGLISNKYLLFIIIYSLFNSLLVIRQFSLI